MVQRGASCRRLSSSSFQVKRSFQSERSRHQQSQSEGTLHSLHVAVNEALLLRITGIGKAVVDGIELTIFTQSSQFNDKISALLTFSLIVVVTIVSQFDIYYDRFGILG